MAGYDVTSSKNVSVVLVELPVVTSSGNEDEAKLLLPGEGGTEPLVSVLFWLLVASTIMNWSTML